MIKLPIRLHAQFLQACSELKVDPNDQLEKVVGAWLRQLQAVKRLKAKVKPENNLRRTP